MTVLITGAASSIARGVIRRLDELYDLKNDPDENHNLIHSKEHQGLIKNLNSRMFDWLEETDGMLIPLRRDTAFRAIERDPSKIRN